MSLIPWRNKKQSVGRGEVSPLATLRTEMDRLFDTFMREPLGALDWPWRGGREAWPAVDVSQSEQEITVTVEIPGIDPKDLEITLSGGELTIAGEKKQKSEDRSGESHVSECCYGAFRRSFTLPDAVDEENVSAEYTNGVLTVTLKKVKPTNVKRIDVKTG